MKEIAIFDLDGTLVTLKIESAIFEKRRSYWASCLRRNGFATELKPLLPELCWISRMPNGAAFKEMILGSFDELELGCDYVCADGLDAVLEEFRARFKILALVTHNGAALVQRLFRNHPWRGVFDVVVTRNEMRFFKPDPRACGLLEQLARAEHGRECWVIGNSTADRALGLNLRNLWPKLVVRTFIIDPQHGEQELADALDRDVPSLSSLRAVLMPAPAAAESARVIANA